MIIRKMTASFGVLKNETLELSPGLNVLQAPNESGKTTWCVFLRTMLYGPDSRRSREGKRLEKLYAPWDGSPMSGEMELAYKGAEMTLRRFDAPAGPMRGVSAVYSGSNVPVADLGGADTGELLTGMTAEVFARTAFIGPAGLGVEPSAELEKKIASLVAAGEEGTAFSQAEESLRSLQRRCRYHGKGLLPGLEQEMAELSAAMEEYREASSRLCELEQREEALEKERRETPERADVRHTALAAREQALALERELVSREREASELLERLRRGPLRGREPTQAQRRTVNEDHRRAIALEKAQRATPQRGVLWLLFLLAGALLALGGLWQRFLLLPAAASLIAGGILRFLKNRPVEDDPPARELARLLKKYGAAEAADIPRRYGEYTAHWRESRELLSAAEALRGRVEAARARAEKLEQAEGEGEQDARSDAEMDAELRRVIEAGARLRGRLEAMGDPAAMESRYACLETERKRLEGKYAALEMALRELSAADEEMHSRFSPALSRKAEGIFRRLSGERYASLVFDRELSAAARSEGSPLPREEEVLSRGTRDQIYLSLRLALCEMTAGEEPCPVILDDALLTFDDERMGYALEYLRELARRRQVILFTCQSREKRYLKKHEG